MEHYKVQLSAASCNSLQVTATERENRQQSEVIASLHSEKDQLEGALYEAQQTVVQLEIRKAQLEGENQELIVRKENLQGKFLFICKLITHL